MDKVIEILRNSIHNAVSVQTQIECNVEKKDSQGGKMSLSSELGGLMRISSDKMDCFMGMFFPIKTFLGLMSSMLGEEYSELEPGLEETVLEFLGVAFGTAVPPLKQLGYSFEKGKSGVLKNYSIEIPELKSISSDVLEIKTSKGNFKVIIFVKAR